MQTRGSNWFLTGGAAVGMVIAAQTGCMPDFDVLSSKWNPSGSGGANAGQGGSTSGTSGLSALGGTTGAGRSNGGTTNGGKPSGRGGKGGSAGKPASGATGGGGTGPGGEGGIENGGNGGEEAGATSVGGTGATGGTGGTGTGGSAGRGTGGSAGSGTSGSSGNSGCDTGFATCPGGDTCSTRLSTGDPSGSTVDNCGQCGVTCATANATTAACTNGACRPACMTNFADCNASTANDGCEASLTSAATCGSCTHRCSVTGAATRTCTSGACAPTCAARYLDCVLDDGTTADDGCETYIDTLTACGATCSDSGTACNPDQVCTTGACGAAAGLVKLSIPFTASGQGQRFADIFALPDLSGATVTVRMYAPGLTGGGTLSTYLVDHPPTNTFGVAVSTDFATLAAGWTDITVSAGLPGGSFDPTGVHQITFDFTTSGAGPWTNPTVIYIDGVWSSSTVVNDTFDSTTGNMVASGLLKIDGSTFTWVSATE